MSKSVIMICEQCLSRNYKNKKSALKSNRLELMKHCPKCNKHTLHKETR